MTSDTRLVRRRIECDPWLIGERELRGFPHGTSRIAHLCTTKRTTPRWPVRGVGERDG
jgi:hypothetical protein